MFFRDLETVSTEKAQKCWTEGSLWFLVKVLSGGFGHGAAWIHLKSWYWDSKTALGSHWNVNLLTSWHKRDWHVSHQGATATDPSWIPASPIVIESALKNPWVHDSMSKFEIHYKVISYRENSIVWKPFFKKLSLLYVGFSFSNRNDSIKHLCLPGLRKDMTDWPNRVGNWSIHSKQQLLPLHFLIWMSLNHLGWGHLISWMTLDFVDFLCAILSTASTILGHSCSKPPLASLSS